LNRQDGSEMNIIAGFNLKDFQTNVTFEKVIMYKLQKCCKFFIKFLLVDIFRLMPAPIQRAYFFTEVRLHELIRI
jgi:hypothetical protein